MIWKNKPKLDQILQTIIDPQSGKSIAAHLIENVSIEAGAAIIVLKIDAANVAIYEQLKIEIEQAALRAKNITSASVILTSEQQPAPQAPAPRPAQKQLREKLHLPHIKNIIAVASGKGGVGKSTVSVNLAAALAQNYKVGLLDADIYGPSQARLLGLSGRAELNADKKLIPFEKFGLRIMSMAVLADPDAAMIWRGPMVQTAILQMLRDVDWAGQNNGQDEALDYLIIDMPPGTGDAQLTLAQSVPLNGAIIVSTPQDLALIDARKGLAMFRKLDVPILGIIENMSYFTCPHCHARSDIFAHGGAKAEAAKDNVPFLGEIPLHMDVRRLSDEGVPIVLEQPDSEIAQIFKSIASLILR